jgi:drug/metabolite transporter (DMT)-like permease
MILLFLMYMLLASTFTIGKAVLCFIKPILFIGIRMMIGGVLLLAFFCFTKWDQISIKRQDWPLFIQVILFHIYLSFTFEFWALQTVSSSKAALIFNCSPFITALLGYWFIDERLTKKEWLGLTVGFSGIIPWIITQSPGEFTTIFLGFSTAEFILFLAVLFSSYGWIVVKQLIQRSYYPFFINGIAMFVGGVLAFFTSLVVEGAPGVLYTQELCPTNAPGIVSLSAMFGIYWAQIILIASYTFLLILLANIIFYNLYGYLLHTYSATFLSFAGITCPVFAALFGWLYLGESITFGFIISFLIISLGLYIFYIQSAKKEGE